MPGSHDKGKLLSRRPRAAAIVACLIALLALMNGLHWRVAGDSVVLRGEPGALLYAAGFDAFDDEWDLYAGTQSAAIVDGGLQLQVDAANTRAWSAVSHVFGDFDMSVDASASAGPLDNAYGVIFALAASDERDCGLPAVILCGLADWSPLLGAAMRLAFDAQRTTSYLAFLISSDGYYSLIESRDGSERRLSDWIESDAIRQGLDAWNTARVVGRGSAYQFFINGEAAALCIPHDRQAASTYVAGECLEGSLTATYDAGETRRGQLGFIAEATQTGGAGVAARFDRLAVFSPLTPDAGDTKA